MNQYQEALERIIVNFCCTCDIFDCKKRQVKKIHYDCPFQEDSDILQEVVDKANKYDEKETPKKIIIKKYDDDFYVGDYYCPHCNCKINEEFEPKYCPNCGQRLGWEVQVWEF